MANNNGMEGQNHLNSGFMDNNLTPITPGIVDPPGILRDPSIPQARKYNTDIPDTLPHEKVFPIQIGTELFKLSGASLSSDGTYFPPFVRRWIWIGTGQHWERMIQEDHKLRILEHPHTFPDIFSVK